MPRSSSPLRISEEQQTQIEHWLAAMGTPQQVALRCRIVLAAATGRPETAIAAETSTNRKTVRLWKERFAAQGLPSLWEIAPGRGRKPTYSAERGPGAGRHRLHPPLQTQSQHTLELPTHGGPLGHEQIHGEQSLAQSQSPAAPHRDFQAVARSEVSGKADRCGGTLPQSTG